VDGSTVNPRDAGRDERPVDTERYVAALRRGGWLIVAVVIPLTVTVLVLSLVLPKTYKASARLVLQTQPGAAQNTDVESQRRQMATIQTLLTSRDVLRQAAATVPGETADTLAKKVSATISNTTNIIEVAATDGDARGAATNANAVARAFIERQRSLEGQQYASARRGLEVALQRLRGRPGSAGEMRALEDRLSALGVSEALPGTDLQIDQAARPPAKADSPRPLQNTVFALFAAVFLAGLVALARERLVPRISGPRELAELLGTTPLVSIPGGRRQRRQAVDDAYQALQASLLVRLAPEQRVVLVTSPGPGEERSRVTARLACALSDAGVPVLAASADLRGHGVDDRLGVAAAPGMTDLLEALRAGEEARLDEVVTEGVGPHGEPVAVLPAGTRARHPSRLLSGEAIGAIVDGLHRSPYRCVLLDGPPLLGPIDGQLLAQWADAILVVGRPDRLTPADAETAGELLERLGVPVLGAVAVGGRRGVAYAPMVTRRAPRDVDLPVG
jgi:Mrp family chromosome partitioning ATPase